jgi:prepilin-type N-terminal cleavage/methylation domain-containing protein
MIKRRHQKGFTLVELAIVMIIIGLLIGGVLKGQQLVENARVNGTIAQLKSYQAAWHSFKDTYAALAGDMGNADVRLKGCESGNANFCQRGNGNSLVGAVQTNGNNAANVSGSTENTQFWKHLALANLITGVEINANPVLGAWGVTHPQSDMRGGYHVYYNNITGGNSVYNGHVLRLTNNMAGGALNSDGSAPLSARELARIDRMIDDGRPNAGIILGDDGRGGASPCEGTAYAENDNGKDCLMIYKIDN